MVAFAPQIRDNAKVTPMSRQTDPSIQPPAAALIRGALDAAALRAERAISAARIVFFAAILGRFLAFGDADPVKELITALPLGLGILFSVAVLLRWRGAPRGEWLWHTSVLLDAGVAFATLVANVLWPTADYTGVVHLLDANGLYVATAAAGFRLSRSAAVTGGVANLVGAGLLLWLDRVVSGERFAVCVATASMFLIFVVAFALLAFIVATTGRRLAYSGARAAVRADRAEQGLGVVLADHHDLRSLLTAATLRADALGQALARLPSGDRELAPLKEQAGTLGADLRRIGGVVLGVKSRALGGVAGASGTETVNVARAVEDALALVRPQFPSVHFAGGAAADLVVSLTGGAATLERILLNLLTNAGEGRDSVHATRVTVSAASIPAALVRLVVEDDGPGFSAAQLADPFRPSLDKPGGFGIGLAVVRGLIEAQSGRLEIANRPEGGARVTVSLPAPPA